MNTDRGRARREPIGVSVAVGAMMLVMRSHAGGCWSGDHTHLSVPTV